MKNQCKSVENLLMDVNVIYGNLNGDDVIKDQILTYGYTQERLDAINQLQVDSSAVYHALLTGRGEQMKYSLLLDDEFKLATRRFSRYKTILKNAFYDRPELVKELKLETATKRTGFVIRL